MSDAFLPSIQGDFPWPASPGQFHNLRANQTIANQTIAAPATEAAQTSTIGTTLFCLRGILLMGRFPSEERPG